MAIKRIKPLSPEISIGRTVGDNAVARIGHVNNLVDQINNDFAGSEMLEAYSLLGSKITSTSLAVHTPSNIGTSGTSMTSGTGIFAAAYVPKDSTVTGVTWYQIAQGAVTTAGTNYNGVGLYSYNAGVLTLVASSTSDNTTTAAGPGIGWKQAIGWAKTAFSAPVAIPAGIYFIGAFYNVTTGTAPSIGTQTTVASLVNNVDFTNSAKIVSTAAFTALPATQLMSGTTVATAQTGFWLYA